MRVTAHGNRTAVRQLATILAAILVLAPGLRDLVAAAPAAEAGSINVSSDPPGALVYVDGRAAGETPLMVDKLTAGDHRVRLVKDGYLENARLVTVAPKKAGELKVTLTRAAHDDAAAVGQVTGGGGGGGGSKKWIIIGAAAGGGVAAALLLANRNHAPSAGTISVSPGATGMASITGYTFTSNASDQDNDSLTFNWNFGDGATGSGASPSHTYATAGTFNVTLSVSDGKASVDAPGATVTVGPNLAGAWRSTALDPGFGAGITVTLTQNGGTLGGSLTFTSGLTGTLNGLTGTATPLTHPSNVTFVTGPFTVTTLPGQTFTIRFTGASNAAGTVLTGSYTETSTSLGTLTGATTFVR
jgi:PKD repeat protein